MTPIPAVFLLLLLLSTTTTTTATTTLSTDITALKSIKSGINPTTIPSYSCLATWNFTSDPCSTPHTTQFLCGLSCSGNRVTQLTFDRAGYAGTLSPLISQLTQLTTIDLSDNKLSGPIPTSLFTLPYLQTLNLRSNSFSGTLPPIITTLKSIETLDISHNSLTGSLPDISTSLTLTRLDLSFNMFTGTIPPLPQYLIELAIKSNHLDSGLVQTSFHKLTQLEVVELSNNSLTGTIPGWFFLQPSIQQVNLAGNGFTAIEIFKPIKANSNLIALDAGYNKIVGGLSANFTLYPMLSSLSLRYNKIHGPIPVEYSKTASLRRLFLDGNYLNGMPPEGLMESSVSGSLGDNCLKSCPASSELCLKSQKPSAICRREYRGKVKLKS